MPHKINVEVCYGNLARQKIIKLSVPEDIGITECIKLSNIEQYFDEFSYESVGIWGKKVADDYQLKDGDRIELYRKLIFDPKIRRIDKTKKIPQN